MKHHRLHQQSSPSSSTSSLSSHVRQLSLQPRYSLTASTKKIKTNALGNIGDVAHFTPSKKLSVMNVNDRTKSSLPSTITKSKLATGYAVIAHSKHQSAFNLMNSASTNNHSAASTAVLSHSITSTSMWNHSDLYQQNSSSKKEPQQVRADVPKEKEQSSPLLKQSELQKRREYMNLSKERMKKQGSNLSIQMIGSSHQLTVHSALDLTNFESGEATSMRMIGSHHDQSQSALKFYEKRMQSHMRNAEFEKAILDVGRVLEIDDKNIHALFTRGNAYMQLKQYANAIEDFEIVLSLDKAHVNAALAKANCLNIMGDYVKAIYQYEDALEKDFEKGTSMLNLSTMQHFSRRNITRTVTSMNSSEQLGAYFDRLEEEELMSIQNEQLQQRLQAPHQLIRRTESVISASSSSPTLVQDNGLQKKTVSSQFKINLLLKKWDDDVGGAAEQSEIDADKENQANEYFREGYAARLKEQFHKAIELYTAAIELKPVFLKAVINRGFLFDKLGDFVRACNDYTRALSIDSCCAFAYFNRGISLDKQNELSLALADFNSAVQLDESNHDFHLNRGNVLQKLDQHAEATHAYSKALEYGTTKPAAVLISRAISYEKCKEMSKAKSDYQNALKLQTNSRHICYSRLASIYQSEDNTQLALTLYNKAIAENSQSLYCLLKRAQVYVKLKLFKLACEDLTAAIAINPSTSSLYCYRGKTHKMGGKLIESTQDFLQALSLKPLDEVAMASLSENLIEMEQFEEAKRYIDVEINEFGEQEERIYKRHVCLIRLGNYSDAEADLKTLLQVSLREFGEEDLGLLRNLSACLMRQKKYEEAELVLTKVIDRSNGSEENNKKDIENLIKFRNKCSQIKLEHQ